MRKPIALGSLNLRNHPIPVLPPKTQLSLDGAIPSPEIGKNNIQLLSNPESAPLSLQIKLNRQYIVHSFIARGSDGAVYEGFPIKDGIIDNRNPLIFKIYSGGLDNQLKQHAIAAFENEVHALSILSRLEECDEQQLIVVMDKLPGESLKQKLKKLLKNGPDNLCKQDEDLIMLLTDKYLMLAAEFTNQYFLVHHDIRPDNVMVDDNGDLHLIDFAKTIPLSENDAEARYQCFIDRSIALNGLGMDTPDNLYELYSTLF